MHDVYAGAIMLSESGFTPESLLEKARQAFFHLNMDEAIHLSQEAIALGNYSDAIRDKIYETYTDVLIAAGRLEEADWVSQSWLEEAQTVLNRANATIKRANIFQRRGLIPEALKMLDEAHRLAEQSSDKSALGKSYRLRADVFWAQGSIEKALFLLQQALAIQEVLRDKEQQIPVLVSMSIVYDLLARPFDSIQVSLRAAKLCEEQQDTFSLMVIYGNIAEEYLHLFALNPALEYIQKARTLLGAGINGDLDRNEGIALIALGEREKGLALLRRGLELGATNDHDELLQAMYSLAEGLITLDHMDEAAQISERLLHEARQLRTERHIARGALLVGQIAGRRNDYEAAERAFQEAFVSGQKSGDKWLIWQAHAAMASTFYEAQPPLAEFHRGTVVEILTGIAASIPDPGLRDTFKNAPPVARWLRDAALSL